VYYVNRKDNFFLYKMRSNGTEKKRILTDMVCHLNVIGDWIYYTNESDNATLYKVRTDGTMRTKLNSDSGSYNTIVVGDWIYYTTIKNFNLYKIKIDGTARTLLSADACSNMNIINGWIYFTDRNDSSVYKMDTNGKNKTFICKNGWFLNIEDNTIYYTNDYSNVCSINTDGTNYNQYDSVLYPFSAALLKVHNGWIYYFRTDVSGGSGNFKYSIYKMRLDGTDNTEIYAYNWLDHANFYINIHGDWIYFPKQDDNDYLYRMKTDGSNLQKMYE